MSPRLTSSELGKPTARRSQGFSMSEIVITISMLGVLAGVVLVQMSGSYEQARETLAIEKMEMLNGNLKQRAVSLREYVLSRSDSSVADELLVLLDCQYRHPDPSKADFNSPYIDPRYSPQTSTSSRDYRLRWTGRMFELLRPGQEGSGLKVVFDGSDIGDTRKYPDNFSSSGR